MKKIIFTCLLVCSFNLVFSQESTTDKIKLQWSKHGKKIHEGFFELNSGIRNYIVAIVADQIYYDILYISGNLENWQEGLVKGRIYLKGNNYVVDWNYGNIVNPSIETHGAKFINDEFVISYADDQDDVFKKISSDSLDDRITKISQNSSISIIHMVSNDSGTFEIPATINDVLKIYFIMDTGASDTQISADVALTLIRTKSIKNEDWLEGKYYQFADGSYAKSSRFIIHTLKIGNIELTNVEASISSSLNAPLLLGQNTLKKLGVIQLDYVNNQITILPSH